MESTLLVVELEASPSPKLSLSISLFPLHLSRAITYIGNSFMLWCNLSLGFHTGGPSSASYEGPDLWAGDSWVVPLNVSEVEGLMRASRYQPSDMDTLLIVYAPWCPFCRDLEASIERLARGLATNATVQVAKIRGDLPESRSFVFRSLDARTFPTIVALSRTDGAPMKYVSTARDVESLLAFMNHSFRTRNAETPPLTLASNGTLRSLLDRLSELIRIDTGQNTTSTTSTATTATTATTPPPPMSSVSTNATRASSYHFSSVVPRPLVTLASSALVLGATLALLAALRGLWRGLEAARREVASGLAVAVADALSEGRDAVSDSIRLGQDLPRREMEQCQDLTRALESTETLLQELEEQVTRIRTAQAELVEREATLRKKFAKMKQERQRETVMVTLQSLYRVIEVALVGLGNAVWVWLVVSIQHFCSTLASMVRVLSATLRDPRDVTSP